MRIREPETGKASLNLFANASEEPVCIDFTSETGLEIKAGESGVDSVATTSSSEDEEAAEFSIAKRAARLPRIPASLKLIQRKKYRTLRLMEKQNVKVVLCGRLSSEDKYEDATSASFDTLCCHTCWRRKKEHT